MLLIKPVNNISFSSKIKIINDQEEMFKIRYGKTDGIDGIKVNGNDFKYSDEKIHTGGMRTCVAYGVVRPYEICALSHNNKYPKDIEDCFKGVDKNQRKEIRGFILGGEPYSRQEYFDRGSRSFENIPTTVLWGKQEGDGISAVCHDVPNDTWYIMPDSKSLVNNADDLRRMFKVIHIAEGDHLFINGNDEEIPASEVNQNDEKYKAMGI